MTALKDADLLEPENGVFVDGSERMSGFAVQAEGPGRGWWGPPKGTHGKGSLGGEDSPLDSSPTKSVSGLGEKKGVNEAYLLSFEDGTQAIFKPRDGMRHGDYRSEALTYEFAEAVGWHGLVPETIMWKYGGRTVGSLQRWVPELDVGGSFGDDIKRGHDESPMGVAKSRIMAIDRILRNGDRHAGNWLRNAEGTRAVAIDNAAAFGRSPMRGGAMRPEDGVNLFGISRSGWSAFQEVSDWHTAGKSEDYLARVALVYSPVIARHLRMVLDSIPSDIEAAKKEAMR